MGTISVLTLLSFNEGVYRKDITSKNGCQPFQKCLKRMMMMTIIFAFLVIIQTLENYIGINKAASD